VQKDGNLLKVTKHSYTQGQARSSGNVQVEYRDLRTGGKVQERLSPSDKVERASLESEEYDYLYDDGTTATAMHPVSFEQIEFPLDELGTTARRFLAEGCVLKVLSFEGERISASLPDEVELQVVEADPSVKGESQDKQFKAAKVGEHEAVVRVPAFVEAGDRVVVDTSSGNFVRRVRR
jgi:elongation factor P